MNHLVPQVRTAFGQAPFVADHVGAGGLRFPLRYPPRHFSRHDRQQRARLMPRAPRAKSYSAELLGRISGQPAAVRQSVDLVRRRDAETRRQGLHAVPVVLNPYWQPPADAMIFDAKSAAWVNFANALPTVVLTHTVEGDVLGVLRFVGISGYYGVPPWETAEFNTTAVDLLVNGIVDNWWNGSPGLQGLYSRLEPNAMLHVRQGDVIQIRVTHGDAVNNWNYIGRLWGWTWPRQEGES